MTEHKPVSDDSPSGPPAASQTSDSTVASAARLLDTVRDLPLDQHPDVYDQVHLGLQSALADINDA